MVELSRLKCRNWKSVMLFTAMTVKVTTVKMYTVLISSFLYSHLFCGLKNYCFSLSLPCFCAKIPKFPLFPNNSYGGPYRIPPVFLLSDLPQPTLFGGYHLFYANTTNFCHFKLYNGAGFYIDFENIELWEKCVL